MSDESKQLVRRMKTECTIKEAGYASMPLGLHALLIVTIEDLACKAERQAAVLEAVKAERQKWLDEDVRNTPYIERLEERQSHLEMALRPFLEAKPMPGSGNDVYVLQGITGEVLRTARTRMLETGTMPQGEIVEDPDDPVFLQHAQEQVGGEQ